MRRLAPLGLALLGAATASPAFGQSPADQGHPHYVVSRPGMSPADQLARAEARARRAGATLVVEGTPPPGVMSPAAPCAVCEQAAASHTSPGNHAHNAESPGYASVGGEAPGYASVGGGNRAAYASAEPAPIGVVQTNYSAGGAMNAPVGQAGMGVGMPMGMDARMSMAPNPAMGMGMGMGMPGGPRPGMIPAPPTPPDMGAAHRPRIFGTLFGVPKFGEYRKMRRAESRSQHAAIAYDSAAAAVTDVPASAVYQNGHR